MGFNPATSGPTLQKEPNRPESTKSEPNKSESNKLSLALSCLCQGRNAEAFLILSGPDLEKEPAAQFALGLCYRRADDLPKAVSCFEQALRHLKINFAPTGESQAADETYLRLAVKQIEAKAYLEPMDADFCAFFPKMAKQTILLALIDTYKEHGMTEQAQKLAAGLVGAEFTAFRNTL